MTFGEHAKEVVANFAKEWAWLSIINLNSPRDHGANWNAGVDKFKALG